MRSTPLFSLPRKLLRTGAAYPSPDEPIRSELFSLERLEQHAESLAQAQTVTRRASRDRRFLRRVRQNAKALARGYREITQAVRDEHVITPAAEWLVDNFYVVEEQIREIIDDLPPGYYRTLPKLTEGPLAGSPRIFGVAWALIAHTDSRLDAEWLRRFVRAYQKVEPLDIGELWALAISLRFLLVENLRRLVDQIVYSKAARQDANALADRLLRLKGNKPAGLRDLLADLESKPLRRAFAVQLLQRLRDQGAPSAEALSWLDQRLTAEGTTVEEGVRLEHQHQTALNTTVRNIITSMRLVSALDWNRFFEDVSVVDELLRGQSRFGEMDFRTRDLYRHAIEQLSRDSGISEIEVTGRATAASRKLAAEAGTPIEANRRGDPGYVLISRGRHAFEKELHCRVSIQRRLLRLFVACGTPAYLGGIALVTAAVLSIPWMQSEASGWPSLTLVVFGLLALWPASDFAVAIVNRLITEILGPGMLPKLDFSRGVPDTEKTIVVMPTLLLSPAAIEDQLTHLELHYLSNPLGAVQFALLTDWPDASTEKTLDDDALYAAAREGIRALNERYGSGVDGSPRFFHFHRRRLWNATQGVWMGWERKRGKLHELNRLLRGDSTTTFRIAPDDPPVPQNIRYVITLDADTRLAQGTIDRLVGTLAHPLNRPAAHPGSSRIREGYGVVQPRITPILPIFGRGSLYSWIFSGPSGIDPYAFAISDVYQDLFKEASYTGKGIYDLDAFEAALGGRAAENTLLSHDLYEGLYARTGLVTHIEVFEEFPTHYEVSVARTHRWVRGDWQLLPYLFKARDLPLISRWKMLDNLRRSLSAPASFLLLVLSMTSPQPGAPRWTLFVLALIAVPPILPALLALLTGSRPLSWRHHARVVLGDLGLALLQVLLTVTFLAHQAWTMADAILRTLYRLTISRRQLIEWTTAAHSKNIFDLHVRAFYQRMLSAPLLALLAAIAIFAGGTANSPSIAAILVLLWSLSPYVAQRLSLPRHEVRPKPLETGDRIELRRIARRTWNFFETFVTEKQHFLPPDNFQEIPHPVTAHRTSPTNIGLYLLACLTARDFGWIGLHDFAERLSATVDTLETLPRYEGHFYNWYDTADLRPLEPLYISTVDSGNLAGHLWTIASACRGLAEATPTADMIFPGLRDTWAMLQKVGEGVSGERATGAVAPRDMDSALASFAAALRVPPVTASDWRSTLDTLAQEAAILVDMARALHQINASAATKERLTWAERLREQVESHRRDFQRRTADEEVSRPLAERLIALAERTDALATGMRFGFLMDPEKEIFSIGYRVSDRRPDTSFYDMLASEARLATFVAIAKGDIAAKQWFHLARPLVRVEHGWALLSWSGSMFEYLMPYLVMHAPSTSLLDQTYRQVVRRQIAYGDEREVPWGISECAYNAQDLEFTYQYSNFGVPGLGLKRGLAEDLLIAPYATALAAMVDPAAAAANFRALAAIGGEGRYGFYEALDFTATRLPEDQKVAVIRTYMAHHQGMTLSALANVLFDGILRHRFHNWPAVRAAELLLQERTPRDVPVARVRTTEPLHDARPFVPPVLRRFTSPHGVVPATHLLSNGRYSVMITAAGSGYSRWNGLAVTRWREDPTRDCWGTYIFIRDRQSGRVWSAAYQPRGVMPDSYQVDFSEDRAEITRRDGSLITTLEVVISTDDDAEIRRVSIRNTGTQARDLEVTSYAEMALATPGADAAHPAFSNLFVQTEFVPEASGLLCTRRPRAPEESPLWAAHVVSVEGETLGPLEYESDRARFLGRGRGIRTPAQVLDGLPLSGTTGAVLDPMVSLRRRVRLEPGETARIAFTTLVADSREAVLILADKYHDPAMFERTVTQAWTQAQIQQHHLAIEPAEAHLFQDLASRILYSHKGLRPSSDILARNRRGQSALWRHAVSGDLPIMLLRIDDVEHQLIARELLRAHEYWRMKNLAVDLVILNEEEHSYAAELQAALEAHVRSSRAGALNAPGEPLGSVFILRGDQLSTEDRILLRTVARVTLLSRQGSLAQQMERLESDTSALPATSPRFRESAEVPSSSPRKPALEFFNGLGGFSANGSEYVITLGPGQWTPAPWINVISNESFGFQVSESGAGYTWAGNSRENPLTPWSNDPVSDPAGEVIYLRDEESGLVWTPTVLPIREEVSMYTSRHGQGWSQFDYTAHGIAAELLQFVPRQDPVKISRLTLTNQSKAVRRLSVTAYVEWALGPSRAASAPFIVVEREESTGALLAQNAWNDEFAERVAFADLAGASAWTADRTEFLGRNGTLDHPAAIEDARPLSGALGAGLDPCAALQRSIVLRPGARMTLVFLLGQGVNRAAAVELLQRWRGADLNAALAAVNTYWDSLLGQIQVRTPERSMDILLNRWLQYQTIACRLWSRAAFYQAGGAYGFRDQLQDVLALVVAQPKLARDHILRAAARQFPEGDVQHWWHPPSGRGVRTHISDDRVWLPYAVLHYLEVTQDDSILEEKVTFLEGQSIPEGREDAYFCPAATPESASLYSHCVRALERTLAVGAHGLPLMGSGDWNDGMNRVGREGRGESVWLAWFLHTTLWEFAKVAEARGDDDLAEKWRLKVTDLKSACEHQAWDGEWYRRAYFDDGSPLGSKDNLECRIDSIAQSWAVISGAADPARGARAMAAVNQHLVRRDERLILLFTPPFYASNPNPGYIQGYLRGVRENGAQYTHAAVWTVLAFAALGDGDRAGELFNLLNPILHSASRADIQRYKVEPYVVAGDVYAEPPHTGRGGWTWYTGAAGWMYRAGVEWILGLRLRGQELIIDPCIPRDWPGFEMTFLHRGTRFNIKVENPAGVSQGVLAVTLNGNPQRTDRLHLPADCATHEIRVVLGRP